MKGLMKGKAGLITGGGPGMGRAAALLFAEHGTKLLPSERTVSKLEKTKKLVEKKGGVCEIFQCDVTDEAQVEAMVTRTVELFGKLDFALSDAAIETTVAPIW